MPSAAGCLTEGLYWENDALPALDGLIDDVETSVQQAMAIQFAVFLA